MPVATFRNLLPQYSDRQISLSHWGIFWVRSGPAIEAVVEGKDLYGNHYKETIVYTGYHYEPLKYTDEITYNAWKRIEGIRT